MVNEYKWIVLLKGLKPISDDHFCLFKSLMSSDLRLERSMQEQYTRVQIADMMEDEFPDDAGLSKLIKFCEDLPALKKRADILKERSEAIGKTSLEINRKEAGPATATSTTRHMNEALSQSERGETSTALAMTSPAQEESATAQKKRKRITKTEGGKKTKLTQKQTQLPEPSGTDIKKDEDCVQITLKPPPTPPSSSSNKKNTTIQKHGITKTEDPQEKQQLGEFSSTSNFPDEGHSAIASNSVQSSQKLLEAHLHLKMTPSFPPSPCQNSPVSQASDSSIRLNSNVHSMFSSGAHVIHEPPQAAFTYAMVPPTTSEAVFLSPEMSSTSTQDLPLPASAAFNSTDASHSQAIGSRNAQTASVPSATLTSKDQFIKMPPPATASSNAQVPSTLASLSKSISFTHIPQTTTSSSNKTLNSAKVKDSKNVQAPQIFLLTVPNYFQTPLAPPSATHNSLTSPLVSTSVATSSAQTTKIHPETGSICAHALQVPPSTVSRSVCTIQLTQGVKSSTGKDLPLTKVTSSRNIQAPHMSSAPQSSRLLVPNATSSTASSSIQAQHAISSTASSSLLVQHGTPSTALSSLLDSHATLPTASNRFFPLQLSQATASIAHSALPGPSATVHNSTSKEMTFSSNNKVTETPKRGIIPKEPAKEEGHQRGPKQVMVLKVTEPFTYDMKEDKRMFHATVATETEFFRVKVFDTALKSKIIPKKIIVISDYFGCNGFLEIYRASCVSDVNVNQTMVISKTLRQRANATPKISYLFSQAKGTFVNGEFVVFTKTERNKLIYYGIEDDTGKMEVVVYGRLTSIRCEPGSKLRLVCFELTSTEDTWQLKSVRHSYMQGSSMIECEGKPLNPDSGDSL
ncbi:Interferon-activable protein 203 [Apodemus speciosus]|uniref:Interferon-activable protein 203 n=1 Tax=Apodemus speciosus TaxID=105296 RepID=A0ABQ0EG26_APOSI